MANIAPHTNRKPSSHLANLAITNLVGQLECDGQEILRITSPQVLPPLSKRFKGFRKHFIGQVARFISWSLYKQNWTDSIFVMCW